MKPIEELDIEKLTEAVAYLDMAMVCAIDMDASKDPHRVGQLAGACFRWRELACDILGGVPGVSL